MPGEKNVIIQHLSPKHKSIIIIFIQAGIFGCWLESTNHSLQTYIKCRSRRNASYFVRSELTFCRVS